MYVELMKKYKLYSKFDFLHIAVSSAALFICIIIFWNFIRLTIWSVVWHEKNVNEIIFTIILLSINILAIIFLFKQIVQQIRLYRQSRSNKAKDE